jgi:hypothetical protein
MDVKQASQQYVGISDVKQAHVLQALLDTYPEIKTKNWKTETIAEFCNHEDIADIQALVDRVDLIPDGFAIHHDEDEESLIFFEVEIHSPMSGDKLRTYGKMAIDFGYYDIGFNVMTVNKYGNVNKVDLLPYYVDWLKKEVQ